MLPVRLILFRVIMSVDVDTPFTVEVKVLEAPVRVSELLDITLLVATTPLTVVVSVLPLSD